MIVFDAAVADVVGMMWWWLLYLYSPVVTAVVVDSVGILLVQMVVLADVVVSMPRVLKKRLRTK